MWLAKSARQAVLVHAGLLRYLVSTRVSLARFAGEMLPHFYLGSSKLSYVGQAARPQPCGSYKNSQPHLLTHAPHPQGCGSAIRPKLRQTQAAKWQHLAS